MYRMLAIRWSLTRRVVPALLCVAASTTIGACSDATTGPGTQELDGSTASVGNGTARVFVLEHGTTPTSIGIELSESALTGLPDSMTMWQLYVPQDYASEIESVPAMGVHWADTRCRIP